MNLNERYGPWALIAGASEGTGSAFARQVAAAGINCILLARRDAPLQALAQELGREFGIETVAASVDLSATDALEQIQAVVGERELGLFISNAGADSTNTRFLDSSLDAWVGQVNRNVMNVVRCCHHFGSQMRERKRGGIILVGSGACYGGSSFMAVYSATKAFDLNFGEGLWAELQPHGVDVLNLILGQTDTPAFRETLAKTGQPVPPNLARPEDVARVGLERLPHGPVHNWGLADDEAGYLPMSAAARRGRILAIDQVTKAIFGEDGAK
ncbi:SDR family oxidoreductase [Pseudomaricurvus sp. HS19]|uniref:SDR family NAD(P)-dependent oxidoreductase n=1 Tax=Pseudomaricurvus sp. HS19 TaxID=2692626 RepID=UPI0013720C59|nr:SDR family NAD(P)-dependent oxidoreductase [Pseudomaricurvus sp. HS19]MYM62622.1 SDR family NAD(P)-dependent oxidoreductase [Pseudomaricurvus sp. HS19]